MCCLQVEALVNVAGLSFLMFLYMHMVHGTFWRFFQIVCGTSRGHRFFANWRVTLHGGESLDFLCDCDGCYIHVHYFSIRWFDSWFVEFAAAVAVATSRCRMIKLTVVSLGAMMLYWLKCAKNHWYPLSYRPILIALLGLRLRLAEWHVAAVVVAVATRTLENRCLFDFHLSP